MATYRQVYTTFWQDEFVLNLMPEEKYFYLYLITNSKTSICGIYEISKKIMQVETGFDEEKIEKFIKKFEKTYKKIKYSEKTNEICIINWIKYNSSRSPKYKVGFDKALRDIKNKKLIQYLYSMDTISLITETVTVTDTVSETETEKEICGGSEISIAKYYENEIGVCSPKICEEIKNASENLSDEIIITCIDEAVVQNKKSWSYISAIINNCIIGEIKTIEEFKRRKDEFKNNKTRDGNKQEPNSPSFKKL